MNQGRQEWVAACYNIPSLTCRLSNEGSASSSKVSLPYPATPADCYSIPINTLTLHLPTTAYPAIPQQHPHLQALKRRQCKQLKDSARVSQNQRARASVQVARGHASRWLARVVLLAQVPRAAWSHKCEGRCGTGVGWCMHAFARKGNSGAYCNISSSLPSAPLLALPLIPRQP